VKLLTYSSAQPSRTPPISRAATATEDPTPQSAAAKSATTRNSPPWMRICHRDCSIRICNLSPGHFQTTVVRATERQRLDDAASLVHAHQSTAMYTYAMRQSALVGTFSSSPAVLYSTLSTSTPKRNHPTNSTRGFRRELRHFVEIGQ
jgi:hypothetical protein